MMTMQFGDISLNDANAVRCPFRFAHSTILLIQVYRSFQLSSIVKLEKSHRMNRKSNTQIYTLSKIDTENA